LRVLKIRKFNIVLLRKWIWRLHVGHGRLWYKVLIAKYGIEGGRDDGKSYRLFSPLLKSF